MRIEYVGVEDLDAFSKLEWCLAYVTSEEMWLNDMDFSLVYRSVYEPTNRSTCVYAMSMCIQAVCVCKEYVCMRRVCVYKQYVYAMSMCMS
jgi:hypothetical protein